MVWRRRPAREAGGPVKDDRLAQAVCAGIWGREAEFQEFDRPLLAALPEGTHGTGQERAPLPREFGLV